MFWGRKKEIKALQETVAMQNKKIESGNSAMVQMINSLQSFLSGNSDHADGVPKSFLDVDYGGEIEYSQLRFMYKRSDVAATIADVIPAAGWSIYPTIKGDNEEGEDFEALSILRSCEFTTYAKRADIMSRIGHYSIICVVGSGDLAQEISATDLSKGFYLRVYCESEVTPNEYYNDFGKKTGCPKTYSVTPTPTEVSNSSPFVIHESRVIHVCQDPLESSLYCDSRLEKSWVELNELVKLQGSLGHGMFRKARPKFAVEWGDEANISGDALLEFQKNATEYTQERKDFIGIRGGKISGLNQSSTTQSKGDYDVLVSSVAASHGIPPRFFGLSAVNTGAEADRASFDGRVASHRADFQTVLTNRFLEILENGGAIPLKMRNVTWEPRPAISEKEQSEIADRKAGAYEKIARASTELGIEDPSALYDECGLINPETYQDG